MAWEAASKNKQGGKNVYWVDTVTKDIKWGETCYMEDLKNAPRVVRKKAQTPSVSLQCRK